jgi:hypothetical protein
MDFLASPMNFIVDFQKEHPTRIDLQRQHMEHRCQEESARPTGK